MQYGAKVPVFGRTKVIHRRPLLVYCVFLSTSMGNYRMLILPLSLVPQPWCNTMSSPCSLRLQPWPHPWMCVPSSLLWGCQTRGTHLGWGVPHTWAGIFIQHCHFPSFVPGSMAYNIFAAQEDVFSICPESLLVTSRNRKSYKIFKYYHEISLSYSNIKMQCLLHLFFSLH